MRTRSYITTIYFISFTSNFQVGLPRSPASDTTWSKMPRCITRSAHADWSLRLTVLFTRLINTIFLSTRDSMAYCGRSPVGCRGLALALFSERSHDLTRPGSHFATFRPQSIVLVQSGLTTKAARFCPGIVKSKAVFIHSFSRTMFYRTHPST